MPLRAVRVVRPGGVLFAQKRRCGGGGTIVFFFLFSSSVFSTGQSSARVIFHLVFLHGLTWKQTQRRYTSRRTPRRKWSMMVTRRVRSYFSAYRLERWLFTSPDQPPTPLPPAPDVINNGSGCARVGRVLASRCAFSFLIPPNKSTKIRARRFGGHDEFINRNSFVQMSVSFFFFSRNSRKKIPIAYV